MRILHFGDIHFWTLGFDTDFYYPKRALGVVNLTLRRRHKFPPPLAVEAAQKILEQEADAVVFSGDMSTMSRNREFAESAKHFAPMHEKWGDRLFVIPGNHDRYTPLSVRQRRYEKHFPYGAFEAGKRVRSAEIDGVRFVGFDASRPFKVRSNGLFDDALESELGAALEGGTTTVLTGHFPYAYPGGGEGKWDHRLLGDDRLQALVGKHKPAAYLHGHKHHRWVLRAKGAADTLAINCGPAGMTSSDPDKHAGWVTFDIDPASGEISALTKHHLDAGGDVVSGDLSER